MLQVELLKMLVQDFEVKEILIDDCGLNERKVPRTSMYRYRKSASCFLQDCYLKYGLNPEDFLIFLAQHLVEKDQSAFFEFGLSFLNQGTCSCSCQEDQRGSGQPDDQGQEE